MSSPLALALEMAANLDRLGVPYVLGGSLASSLIGEPRATLDIDLAVEMQVRHVDGLVSMLGDDFYASREAAVDAVRRASSFNVIHLDTMQKVDLFVLGNGLLDRRQLRNREMIIVSDDPPAGLWVGAAADQVLRKLDWYRIGGELSDRQWRDVIAILRSQAEHIDPLDLVRAAVALGLERLLARAAHDAGFVLPD